MSDFSPELITFNKSLITTARNFINSCSTNGLDYNSMKNRLENAFHQPVDIILSIIHDEFHDDDYQNRLKSIKIPALQRLADRKSVV